MDDETILALYQWQPAGRCFRCAATGGETTLIREVRTPLGDEVEFRACKDCVLILERERRLHAKRAATRYEPGRLRH